MATRSGARTSSGADYPNDDVTPVLITAAIPETNGAAALVPAKPPVETRPYVSRPRAAAAVSIVASQCIETRFL